MGLARNLKSMLKPCPFCGEEKDLMFASCLRKLAPYDPECHTQQFDVWIQCNRCGGKFGTNTAEIDQSIGNLHGYDYLFVDAFLNAIEMLIIGWNKRNGGRDND